MSPDRLIEMRGEFEKVSRILADTPAIDKPAQVLEVLSITSRGTNMVMHGAVRSVVGALVAMSLVGWLRVGAVVSQAAEEKVPTQRPNIVLCMADDQGWGDVAYNGHPRLKTPTLDAMATSGLRFNRFYAAAPVCSPTRGSVLTGRHPNRYGCFSWGHTLRPQEVTIAEALKAAGYATGHFGKWHLGSVRRESPVCPGNSGFDEWLSSPNFYGNDPLMCHNGTVIQTKGESSHVAVEAALTFIRQVVRRKQPFLAVIWFGSPHAPHKAIPQDREPYKDLPPKLQDYLGEITGIDRAMKVLRDGLRELGVAENTLVWYTSDNGARKPGSTGGLRGQKGTIWEGGLRVPAIIEWPARIPEPRQTDLPCGTVDIYPTLLEIVGVKVPGQVEPLDGVSLVSLIDGAMTSRPRPLGFWQHPAKGRPRHSTDLLKALAKEQQPGGPATPTTQTERDAGNITKRYPDDTFPGHAAWLDGNYKLHRIEKANGSVMYELFDLASDTTEGTNLADQQRERFERMKAQLEQWQRSVVKSLNGGDYGGD